MVSCMSATQERTRSAAGEDRTIVRIMDISSSLHYELSPLLTIGFFAVSHSTKGLPHPIIRFNFTVIDPRDRFPFTPS